ncbi:unnamed protein product [Boreogadus saida]
MSPEDIGCPELIRGHSPAAGFEARPRTSKPGRGLSEDRESLPDPGSRLQSPITGSAARPSTGLQTGLHTTGLDIMSYDIQIFHVLVTPGTSSTTPDTPSKRGVQGSRRDMRRARQSCRNGGEDVILHHSLKS